MGGNGSGNGRRVGSGAREHLRRALDVVQQSGLAEKVGLRRPTPLPAYLDQLLAAGPRSSGGSPDPRDTHLHLGRQWVVTAAQVAQPDSLPEVVERRRRYRVNPAAPWSTAAVAAAGAGAVVAGPWPAAVEVLAVAGVAGLSALGSSWVWKPRVARRDRRHTVRGAAALAARADVIVASHSSLDDGTAQALLGRVHGAARAVEAVEAAARGLNLLDEAGNLAVEPQVPAQRQVVEEVLQERAELVHLVLSMQQTTQTLEARLRREDRASYQQLLDDLGQG